MNAVFFLLVSTLWSFFSWLARVLVALGFLKSARLPVRVVSVGNIQAGGAGKTPLVAQIAREAESRGILTCILCRGYGGEWEGSGGVISPGAPNQDPVFSGDEAALLHGLAPAAWIGIGSDRIKQFNEVMFLTQNKIELVILDDGFQHWKIKKNLEILALTSKTRFNALFRDWSFMIRKAQLVVWTKGERAPRAWGRPTAQVKFQIAPPKGSRKYWFVTGIADPKEARLTAEKAGYSVEKHVRFPDHARYEETSVRAILASARAASCSVLVTGKDWVKLRAIGFSESEVEVLEPTVHFQKGKDDWDRLLWGDA